MIRVVVVPKGHNTGKWWLITNLSFLPGRSVNDEIEPALCSLFYMSVELIAEIVTLYGRGLLH